MPVCGNEAEHRGRLGAGDESTRSNVAGDGQTDYVVASSGDHWDKLPADAALAAFAVSRRNACRWFRREARARSLQQISIMRPFDPAELSIPLSKELIAELKWEEQMAEKTDKLYST